MHHILAFATVLAAAALAPTGYDPVVQTRAADLPRLTVRPTDDFEVTGEGASAAWEKT